MERAKSRREIERLRRQRERERKIRARRRRALLLMLVLIAAVVGTVLYLNRDKGTAEELDNQIQTENVSTRIDNNIGNEVLSKESFFDNSAILGNSIANSVSVYGIIPATDIYSNISVDIESVYTTQAENSTTSIIDHLKGKSFKKVFLIFGEMELKWEDNRRFYKSYCNLLEDVISYQPKADIYLVGIPPVSINADDGVMHTIKAYNNQLIRLAANYGVKYVNSVNALKASDGYLPDNVSADGINLDKDSCIKLLNYASKKAYVPSLSDDDLSDNEKTDEDDENEADEEATAKPSKASSDSGDSKSDSTKNNVDSEPEPTVNVFKSSAVRNNGGGL